MIKAQWDYYLDGASGWWGKQPATAPTNRFPFLAGIDGRYDGVLRRYPGHIRYARTQSRSVEDCDEVFPFIIQSGIGSNDKARGYLACNTFDGSVEVVWRLDTDTADELRTTDIYSYEHAYGELSSVTDTSISYTGGPFSDPASTTSMRIHKLYDYSENGTVNTIAIGDFQSVGARHCTGIAIKRGNTWAPLGFPAFNGPIYDIIEFSGKLYVCGAFTKYLSKDCKGIAVWDGTSWAQHDVGITGTAQCMVSHSSALWIGGDFTTLGDGTSSLRVCSSDGSTITAKTGTAGFNDGIVYSLASFNSTLFAGGTFTADGGANAISQPFAYLASGTNWDYVGGTGTIPTFTIVKNLLPNPAGTRLFINWVNSTTDIGVESITTASAWADELNYIGVGSVDSDAEIVLSVGTTNVYAGVVNTFMDSGDRAVYQSTAGGGWTELSSNDATGYILEHSDGSLSIGAYLSLPLDQDADIGQNGCTFDVCYIGPYVYLYCSNGNHRVIYYDADSDDLVSATLGPGRLWLPKPTLDEQNDTTQNCEDGNYEAVYRYIDRNRNRFTAISDSDTETVQDGDALRLSPPTDSYGDAPSGYTRMQPLSTISSGAFEIPAGGTLYRVGEGSIDTSTMRFVQSDYHENSDDAIDDGSGTHNFSTTDLSFTQDPTRVHDFIREEVFDVGAVAACGILQSSVFVLEVREGFLDIRWSPTSRFEPENFPTANVFATNIPSEVAGTCKFVQAGDYLYCFGGNYMYRIQKSGTSVGIIELHSDYPFIHKNGFVKVGTRIYAVHEMGIMVIEAKTGNATDLPSVQRLFYDRWRGQIVPNITGTASTVICGAYDARMRCIYFHHRALDETLCLWLSTGKISLLVCHRAHNCMTMPDLSDKMSLRAYFVEEDSRWVAAPNWNASSTEPQTMTGWRPYSTGQEKYNATVSSSTGATITLIGAPFSSDGSTLLPSGRIYCAVLNGDSKFDRYRFSSGSTSLMTLQAMQGVVPTNSSVAGDVIAIDPIIMEIVGANLPEPEGNRPKLRHRKRVQRQTIQVQRLTSNGGGNVKQLAPAATDYGLVTLGTLRNEGVIAHEPLAGPVTRLFTARTRGECRLGNALSLEVWENWVTTNGPDEGTLLYPYFLCMSSNYGLELINWTIDGSLYGGDIVGS